MSASRNVTQPARAWYREPWPWILMAGPVLVVIAGFVTLWLAATTFDGLVVDDYYKEGLAINRSLERDQRAAELGLEGEVTVADQPGRVRVLLRADAPGLPAAVRILLAHPARPDLDQAVVLGKTGEGAYEGVAVPLAPGRWLVTLEDEEKSWRLVGIWKLPQDQAARLRVAGGPEQRR